MPTTNPYPNVPPPAGAHHVGEWSIDGGVARRFKGTMGGLDICVDIQGDQGRDGTIDRYAVLYGDAFLDAPGARAAAADLLAAADEMEMMNERDCGASREDGS